MIEFECYCCEEYECIACIEEPDEEATHIEEDDEPYDPDMAYELYRDSILEMY